MEEEQNKFNVLEFITSNSHKLMTIFIIIQTLANIVFMVLFLLSETSKDYTVGYKIFIGALIIILNSFMIHFAYHSVSLIF